MRFFLRVTPLKLIRIFMQKFLPWYFIKQPVAIVKAYIAYAGAIGEISSIVFLLKTLFSPWKSIADTYPKNMMLLGKVIQVFTLNCIARAVGAVVRTLAIMLALVIQLVLLALFVLVFLFWIIFPLIAVAFVNAIYVPIVF